MTIKFDNVVLDPDNPLKIVGVLDWEMATVGDPLMDLGSSLGYWIQSDDPPNLQAVGMQPTSLPGALTRDELVRRYAEKAGIRITNFDFYFCFGLFRLAVIAQQIYYRFYHGQTKDERFKFLIIAVTRPGGEGEHDHGAEQPVGRFMVGEMGSANRCFSGV